MQVLSVHSGVNTDAAALHGNCETKVFAVGVRRLPRLAEDHISA